MRTLRLGFLCSLAMSATAIAAKQVTSRVYIQCDCVGKYPRWVCETFWWALC